MPKTHKKRFLGCHVSCAGGLQNALVRAKELGVNSIQIHPSPPQRYNRTPFVSGCEVEYLKLLPDSGVERVFFHGIYLINLANPDEEKIAIGKSSLKHYLDLQVRAEANGVIFHVGSLKDEPSEEVGLSRAAAAIDDILKDASKESRLLLEVSAGSGKVIGSNFSQLTRIYSMLKHQDLVGFVLDTQHMWASGYDLKNDLEGVIRSLKELAPLNKIYAIHFNDSKTELASKKDRHADLGEGLMGAEALKAILNHPSLIEIPFIMETPSLKDMEGSKGQVAILHSWVKT
jgi:deoxyribonuclease IV